MVSSSLKRDYVESVRADIKGIGFVQLHWRAVSLKSLYTVIVLSDRYRLPFSVDSFIVLSPTHRVRMTMIVVR